MRLGLKHLKVPERHILQALPFIWPIASREILYILSAYPTSKS